MNTPVRDSEIRGAIDFLLTATPIQRRYLFTRGHGKFTIIECFPDGSVNPHSNDLSFPTMQDFLLGVQKKISEGWEVVDSTDSFYTDHSIAYMRRV